MAGAAGAVLFERVLILPFSQGLDRLATMDDPVSSLLSVCLARVCRRSPPVETMPAGVSWPAFCDLVDFHGVGALLYRWVKDIHGLPSWVEERLRLSWENALVFRDHCAAVVRCLHEAGSTAPGRIVLCQGMALAEHVYDDRLARGMSDVDLFLPDGTAGTMRRSLAREGFVHFRDYADVWVRNGFFVDLHEDLWGSDRIPARSLVAPKVPAEFQPSRRFPGLWVLSPRFAAVHSAFHGLKHAFSRRVWACDMALLLRAGHFGEVAESARDIVGAGLRCCVREGVIDEDDLPVYARMSTLRGRLVDRVTGDGAFEGSGEIALALSAESPGRSVAYGISSAFPPWSVLRQMYGDHEHGRLVLLRLRSLVQTLARGAKWLLKM